MMIVVLGVLIGGVMASVVLPLYQIPANKPMIAITTNSSISVKPF